MNRSFSLNLMCPKFISNKYFEYFEKSKLEFSSLVNNMNNTSLSALVYPNRNINYINLLNLAVTPVTNTLPQVKINKKFQSSRNVSMGHGCHRYCQKNSYK